MNFYKNNRKLILYGSIILVPILLIYLILKFLIYLVILGTISFEILTVFFLITSIVYVYMIPIIFKRLDLQPREDILNSLSRDKKIKFYEYLTKVLKFWNMILLVLYLLFIISIVIIIIGLVVVVINALKTDNSTLHDFLLVNSIMKFGTYISAISFISFMLVALCGIIVAYIILPTNKLSGLIDTSDIVISFIKKAIDEINSFDFSLTWNDTKRNKNKISNFINDALEYITIEDKFLGIPIGWRYDQQFIAGLGNRPAKRDILSRINSLDRELTEVVVELNCMNTVKDKENIADKLTKYLIIVETKNLCELEKSEFKKHDLILRTIKKITSNPIEYILKIIFASK